MKLNSTMADLVRNLRSPRSAFPDTDELKAMGILRLYFKDEIEAATESPSRDEMADLIQLVFIHDALYEGGMKTQNLEVTNGVKTRSLERDKKESDRYVLGTVAPPPPPIFMHLDLAGNFDHSSKPCEMEKSNEGFLERTFSKIKKFLIGG